MKRNIGIRYDRYLFMGFIVQFENTFFNGYHECEKYYIVGVRLYSIKKKSVFKASIDFFLENLQDVRHPMAIHNAKDSDLASVNDALAYLLRTHKNIVVNKYFNVASLANGIRVNNRVRKLWAIDNKIGVIYGEIKILGYYFRKYDLLYKLDKEKMRSIKVVQMDGDKVDCRKVVNTYKAIY